MGVAGKPVVLNFRVSEETRAALQARAERDHDGNLSAAVRAAVDAAELLDRLRDAVRQMVAEGGALDAIEVYSLLLYLGGEEVAGLTRPRSAGEAQ